MTNENINGNIENTDTTINKTEANESTDNPADGLTDVDNQDLTANAPAEGFNTSTVGDGTDPTSENGTDIPAEDGNDVPAENGTDVPTEDGNDVPTEDGTNIHAENGTDVPTEDDNDVPAENGNDVPAENSNDVHAENSNDVHAENGTDGSLNAAPPPENSNVEDPSRGANALVPATPSTEKTADFVEAVLRLIVQNIDVSKLKAIVEQFTDGNEAQLMQADEQCEKRILFVPFVAKTDETKELKRKYDALYEKYGILGEKYKQIENDNYALYQKDEELINKIARLKVQIEALKQENCNLVAKYAAFNIQDYVDETACARESLRKELAEKSEAIAAMSVAERQEAIKQANDLQRATNDMLDRYRADLFSQLDQWRTSMFKQNFEGLARWYAKFAGYVGKFDARLIAEFSEAPNNGQTPAEVYANKISKMRDKLQRECADMEKNMPDMGLAPFRPMEGDDFDPEFHDLDEEMDEPGPWTIVSCERPGVRLLHPKDMSAQVLVKAMVTVRSKTQ